MSTKIMGNIGSGLYIIVAALFVMPGISGCGQHKDDAYTAPSGSKITLSADSISHGALSSTGTLGSFQYSIRDSFRITVTDATGNPINNAYITINAPYSAGSGGGSTPTVIYLIDGDTGVQVSTYPYQTQTGEFGTKDMILNLDLSNSWGPVDIAILSGTASAKLTVQVN